MKEIIIEVPDRFGETLEPEKVNAEIKGEIVRCKDCENNIGGRCKNLDLWVETDPEWFCADGEKVVKWE